MKIRKFTAINIILCCCLVILQSKSLSAESWLQYKFDSRHSGNVPQRSVQTPLTLCAAIPLTDAVFTAPVVKDNKVYIVDGSGVAMCYDTQTKQELWRFASPGGKRNCNNVSSPALAGSYLHFGTMAGNYYVLDAANGRVVKKLSCGEPIFCSPVVNNDRVYFATLGSQVYALEPDGTICWKWDYVKEVMKFNGDRWSGTDWLKHFGRRVSTQDMFCCRRDLAVHDNTLIVPAGGSVVWLQDTGPSAKVAGIQAPRTTTLGLSVGEDGTVYRQWTLLDNGGRVDKLILSNGEVKAAYVRGTLTNTKGGLLGLCSVSLRGRDVYRTRPQEGFGLCRHTPTKEIEPLGGYPAIASPVLLQNQAVFGGLDGKLYIVGLNNPSQVWSFPTAFGKAITAPVAVCDGRIFFGCEDGYLYILGPQGKANLTKTDLQLTQIRSPLAGSRTDAKFDRFTSFANFSNTNQNTQDVKPPFKLKWIRRYAGTGKHFSTFGGGRMYTHTAEGMIFAVEQETGRLLWRKYYPGVFISYTSPLYHQGRLLVPQAGLDKCLLRCLDAATGKLIWEAPFAGSPSWNRQQPPVVYKNLVIYMYGTGRYGPGTNVEWLFGHQDMAAFPPDHKPFIRAWDLETGREVWTREFSRFGSGGNDAGLCLMDDVLYYSCYFGFTAKDKQGNPSAQGLTAAMNPQTGNIDWQTTKYFIHSGCTISGSEGRLYLGGYAKLEKGNSFVWCIDARDGSLIWKSDPLREAIHVVTIGPRFLFVHAQYQNGFILDKQTGKIVKTLTKDYKCTRFTLSEPYLLGSNLDIYDMSETNNIHLITTGPRLDPSECVGAVVSNGHIFYTAHGGGLQACLNYDAIP
jgi:outer membrane protein assembly factor BamB